jgi:hypothetical protein
MTKVKVFEKKITFKGQRVKVMISNELSWHHLDHALYLINNG